MGTRLHWHVHMLVRFRYLVVKTLRVWCLHMLHLLVLIYDRSALTSKQLVKELCRTLCVLINFILILTI